MDKEIRLEIVIALAVLCLAMFVHGSVFKTEREAGLQMIEDIDRQIFDLMVKRCRVEREVPATGTLEPLTSPKYKLLRALGNAEGTLRLKRKDICERIGGCDIMTSTAIINMDLDCSRR